MMEASFENRTDRAVTILLVLILHALLILALLRFMSARRIPRFAWCRRRTCLK
jgi:hypothetical protein